MPRSRSKSGIYHIVMRGINRQSIFEDEEDCVRFIQTLQKLDIYERNKYIKDLKEGYNLYI